MIPAHIYPLTDRLTDKKRNPDQLQFLANGEARLDVVDLDFCSEYMSARYILDEW